MHQEIFTVDGKSFLSKKMGICLKDLTQKIISDTPTSIDFFKQLISFILTLNPSLEYGKLDHANQNLFLNKELYAFFKKFNFDDDSMEHFIFDNIRHAFINYCQGGILEVYKHREAEGWYPKIIIDSNLGDRNDIERLNNEVVIYRGTSKDEYNSKTFGQSWTLDEEIANKFAFEHYEGQPDYENTTRVILKAKINKQHIYYYKEENKEQEVIVNSNMIISNSIDLLEEALLE